MKDLSSQKGFTLIEALIYISIAGVILSVMGSFWGASLSARAKSIAVLEVEVQGEQIINQFSSTVHLASAINFPTPESSADTLSLSVLTPNDPTVFSLNSGTISIKEGSASSVPLHSAKVTVSNLIFKNLSGVGTPGTVQISFTLTYNNSSGRSEFDYSKTFYGSATLYKLVYTPKSEVFV